MNKTMTSQKNESRVTLDRWLQQAKCCGQVDHYLGKRRTVRFQWQTYVQIEVQNPNGTVEYLYATTKDISESGLALTSRQPIDPRAQIRIQLDDEDQFGIEIRNSRDDGELFGLPNVSRVIIGGTIGELGLATLGIAESRGQHGVRPSHLSVGHGTNRDRGLRSRDA